MAHRSRRSRHERGEARTHVPQGGGKRLAVLLVATVACGWLAWQIVSNTVADTRNPALALEWRPDHARHLITLAEQQLIRAEDASGYAAARNNAEHALLVRPVSPRALRAAGFVAEAQGDARAGRLIEMAGERAPRDALTQIWLLDRDMRSNSLAGTVDRLDRILRSRPNLAAYVSPIVAGLVSDPATRDKLAERMGTAPPWRPVVLARLAAEAPPATALAVYDALLEQPLPPTGAEVRALLERLVADNQPEQAYFAWRRLRPDASGGTPYLVNGGFDDALSGMPFDWTIDTVRGARTEIAEAGDRKALRVTFSGSRVGYNHVSQLLVLPAGAYRLSGEGFAPNLENERGLIWHLRCSGGEVLASSPNYAKTPEWRPFEVAFSVPAEGCRSQVLRLELDARVALEQQVGGEIWFDNLKVRRLPGEAVAGLN